MMDISLVEAHTGQQLRQKHTQHIRVRKQNFPTPFAAKELIHLGQNALRCHSFQQPFLSVDSLCRGRLYGKAQGCGKAQRP